MKEIKEAAKAVNIAYQNYIIEENKGSGWNTNLVNYWYKEYTILKKALETKYKIRLVIDDDKIKGYIHLNEEIQ